MNQDAHYPRSPSLIGQQCAAKPLEIMSRDRKGDHVGRKSIRLERQECPREWEVTRSLSLHVDLLIIPNVHRKSDVGVVPLLTSHCLSCATQSKGHLHSEQAYLFVYVNFVWRLSRLASQALRVRSIRMQSSILCTISRELLALQSLTDRAGRSRLLSQPLLGVCHLEIIGPYRPIFFHWRDDINMAQMGT